MGVAPPSSEAIAEAPVVEEGSAPSISNRIGSYNDSLANDFLQPGEEKDSSTPTVVSALKPPPKSDSEPTVFTKSLKNRVKSFKKNLAENYEKERLGIDPNEDKSEVKKMPEPIVLTPAPATEDDEESVIIQTVPSLKERIGGFNKTKNENDICTVELHSTFPFPPK